MNSQVDKVKDEFAKRLHKAMDMAGYPVRGRARILSQKFQISDKGAGKWLNGEAIPETSKIPLLSVFLGISSEWLLTGLGEMTIQNTDKTFVDTKAPKVMNKKIQNIIDSLILLDSQNRLNPNAIEAIESIIKISKNS
ncbi:hypothetical protein [Acinetobacter courvalinii]|uniref:Uncharacterized protein n=1 Tax=Acinetobacter courvalinii TaxID=280147 RepID=A0AA42I7R2_9GAMM|nr:hypothetical protein [Acinetobacter courvalinii]MDH0562872.1 hypothetical protein [Acinetobacter courvalinii]